MHTVTIVIVRCVMMIGYDIYEDGIGAVTVNPSVEIQYGVMREAQNSADA